MSFGVVSIAIRNNKNEKEMFQREEKIKRRKMDLSLIGAYGKGMFIYKRD